MLPPVISPERAGALDGDVVFADVRWYLDGRSGREAFEAGHVPGAVHVDLDTDLADHDRPPTEGRHPFPRPEAFAAAMGRLGMGDDTVVVGYDDSGGGTAGRLVWMLRVLGRHASLLDGGLNAWPAPHETGPGRARAAARFSPGPWPADRFVDAAGAAEAAARGVALDARAGDRFRGESEPVDRRAGHIPGAHNAPWTANLDPDTGRFRTAAELRARFDSLLGGTADNPVCYCGSGVSACADLLALERAGRPGARLYVASWSGWSADPARPVATGP